METMVDDIGVVVVEELKAASYKESTIGNYQKSIRWLALLARKHDGLYTPALGAEFALMTTSPRTGHFSAQRRFDYGRLVTVFDSYVLTGRVSLVMRNRGGGMAVPHSADFVALWKAWSGEMERRGLATATRSAYGRAAREYLLFLEASGIRSLDAADGTTVLGYLESLQGRWARSALWTARVRRWHQLVPELAERDERLVVRACTCGEIPARDAAVTLLALVTGLRACDIIALSLIHISEPTRRTPISYAVFC